MSTIVRGKLPRSFPLNPTAYSKTVSVSVTSFPASHPNPPKSTQPRWLSLFNNIHVLFLLYK